MEPVRMNTPASASDCPTVGANCRGGVTTDAMGWLKCGADGTLLVPGRASTLRSVHEEEHRELKYTQTHAVYPGSGPSCGGNTPTPACLSLYSEVSEVTKCSSSCVNTLYVYPEEEEALRESLGFRWGK